MASFEIRGGATDSNLQWKTAEFNRFLNDMKARLGDKATMRQIVDSEVGRIMETAVEKTGKASAEKIKIRVKNRANFNIGDKKWRLRDWKTGKGWHVPDPIWAEIEKKRARSLARKLGKIGLAKQSWFWIAQKLGQMISVPAYVAGAKATKDASGGPANVSVQRASDADKYGVAISNRMPIITFGVPNGRQALFSAIAGRVGFYRKNLAKGVFGDMSKVAAKYKGIFVSPR